MTCFFLAFVSLFLAKTRVPQTYGEDSIDVMDDVESGDPGARFFIGLGILFLYACDNLIGDARGDAIGDESGDGPAFGGIEPDVWFLHLTATFNSRSRILNSMAYGP